MRARHLIVTLGTALLLAAGCSSDGDGGSDERIGGLDPEEVSKQIPSHLEVEASGKAALDFDGDVDLRIVTIGTDAPLQFLSVGLERLVVTDDGAAFRIAFDLAGAWQGRGRYEIPASGGATTTPSIDANNPDPNAAASGLSRVYLTYSPEGDITANPEAATSLQSFENVLEPCRLEVRDDEGRSGTLTCPKVADSGGDSVRIVMGWSER